jgi:hypothetical protein
MGERAPCPYCTRGSTALTKRGLLAHHNGRYGVPCPAGGLTVEEARVKKAFDERTRDPRRPTRSTRPTIKVMVGGETGEGDCGLPVVVYTGADEPWSAILWWLADEDGAWSPLDALPGCTAPTPEAP